MRRLAATVIAVLTVTSLSVAARAAVASPPAGRHIVALRDTAAGSSAVRHARADGVHIDREYHHALDGFAAALSASQLAALRADPGVKYVVPDGAVAPDAGGPYRSDVGGSEATGAGVTAYVIDCGFDDADTLRYWAPAARVYPTQVCDGRESAVLSAIDSITAGHAGPTVVSLGLSGAPSRALDEAIAGSVRAGVVYAVTAGSHDRDACDYSPGRSSAVITAGANPARDFGPCVTLFAGTPMVAAAAALYLQAHPAATPAAVTAWLIAGSTKGILRGLPAGTPNRVLNIGV